jgi:hypothetical protein
MLYAVGNSDNRAVFITGIYLVPYTVRTFLPEDEDRIFENLIFNLILV